MLLCCPKPSFTASAACLVSRELCLRGLFSPNELLASLSNTTFVVILLSSSANELLSSSSTATFVVILLSSSLLMLRPTLLSCPSCITCDAPGCTTDTSLESASASRNLITFDMSWEYSRCH